LFPAVSNLRNIKNGSDEMKPILFPVVENIYEKAHRK
jgi:hypothetical protein